MSGFPAAYNTTRDEQPAYGQAGTASIPPGHGVVVAKLPSGPSAPDSAFSVAPAAPGDAPHAVASHRNTQPLSDKLLGRITLLSSPLFVVRMDSAGKKDVVIGITTADGKWGTAAAVGAARLVEDVAARDLAWATRIGL